MADPQALHAELLDTLKILAESCSGSEPLMAAHVALSGVVELHKPRPCFRPCSLRHEHVTCPACRSSLSTSEWYPCPTVKVISSALGVTTDG